jgi:flagellin
MPLSISTNIASLSAQRSFLNSNAALETSYERLASGKRINSSSDDAAGLAIAVDLSSRVSGTNQAIRNVNDGISMVQIMDGAYDEVTSILQRMRDMAVQAANGSLSGTEKGYLETEQNLLVTALNDAMNQAKFSSTDLVSDTSAGAVSVTIQSGAGTGDTVSISLSTASANNATTLGVGAVDLSSDGTAAIGTVDAALTLVAGQRATLGAHQAQLESTVRNLANVAENTAAAAGRIMDTDYAAETANLTKAQILQQAATSVLAQANAQPQAVLSLLQ